jgi:polyhydroxybutyrate depolymerase
MPAEVPPDTEISIDVGDSSRTALLRAPTTAPIPRPLVLAFHGYGGGMWDLGYMGGLSDLAETEGFVVAYPQGIGEGPTWDLQGGSDIPFALALIDELVASQCVDPARVFATGFSMGGGMTNLLACRTSDRIAAIAPVAANHGSTWGDPCVPSRPVPILAFHGTLDEALPYEGGDSPFPDRPVTPVEDWMAEWAATNGCSGEPAVASVAEDVDSLTWQGCAAPTTLYRVIGGGHTWPGGLNDPGFGYSTDSVSASQLLWDLFAGSGTARAR